MAQITVARRNAAHELMIQFTDEEAGHLFGDTDPGGWLINYEGRPDIGFKVWSVADYEGHATRKVMPLPKTIKNKVWAARVWLQKTFGTVQQFRDAMPAKPILADDGSLEFRALPPSWIDEGILQHRAAVEQVRVETAQEPQEPPQEPEAAGFVAAQDNDDKADPTRKPLPAGLMPLARRALAGAIGHHGDEDGELLDRRPPAKTDTAINDITKEKRRHAFDEVLRLAGLLNAQAEIAGKMVELAVDDKNRLVIKRVYLMGVRKP